jgi:hypothetical protein
LGQSFQWFPLRKIENPGTQKIPKTKNPGTQYLIVENGDVENGDVGSEATYFLKAKR